jgi:putative membrane protein
MHWMYGFNWGWMVLGGLLMVFFWGALIVAVVLAVQALTRAGSRRPVEATGTPDATPGRALEILKERYARGEITKEQYDSMRHDLTM